MAVRTDTIDTLLARPNGRARCLRKRLKSGLWAAVATLLPLAVEAQGLQLGTINIPVNLPSVTTTTITVPTNVLGSIVNVPVSVVGAVNSLSVLPTTITVPINLLGNPINVSVNLPGTTVSVTAGPVSINVPINVNAPISINIGGLVGAINTLSAIVTVRRNDTLLGLDLGLDRQIDILSAGSGHWDDPSDLWSEPSALGGPRPSSAMLDTWGSGAPNRLGAFSETFATSLQQARQASAATPMAPPYGLGANSR